MRVDHEDPSASGRGWRLRFNERGEWQFKKLKTEFECFLRGDGVDKVRLMILHSGTFFVINQNNILLILF